MDIPSQKNVKQLYLSRLTPS